MKHNPILYIDKYLCNYAQKEIHGYCAWIENRLFSCINSWEDEENRAVHELESNGSRQNYEYYDPITNYEKHVDLCFQYAEINGYMIGMSIVGLYHIWEKQVIQHLKRELNQDWVIADGNIIKNWKDILDTFEAYSTDLTSFDFYKNLNELRLVANTIKHGDGDSYKTLCNIQANITKPYQKSNNQPLACGQYSLLRVEIYPEKKDFDKYKTATLDFWNYDFWNSLGERRPFDRWPEKKK